MLGRKTTLIAIAAAAAVAAAGCAQRRSTASTGVVAYGPGAYRISMSSSRQSLADLEMDAIREANEFCSRYRRVMVPDTPETIMSPKAYYALTFRCVQRTQ